MSKTTKRWLGIAVATVLIVALGIAGFVMASTPAEEPVCYKHGDVNGDGEVTKDDAIYLLYASFPGLSAEFPLQNDGKINSDDVIDKDDAIYLLYASFPDPQIQSEYPLKGEMHSYYDPTWTWDEDAGTAKVTFKCGCGGEHIEAAVVTSRQISDPTCVAAGAMELTAKATYNGAEYTDTKTIVIPANGRHALNEASCTTDLECANCDYKVAASGHSFVLQNTTSATCTAEGEEVYKCSACSEIKRVTLEKLQHQLTYIENGDIAGTAKCQFIKQYKCSVCSGVFDGTGDHDVYTKHTYVTTLTNEATCMQDGLKTTACALCGDVKGTETEAKDPSKHLWNNGTESAGKITFTCTVDGCGATRTEIVASQDGAVDTSDLNADTGVNLGNASIALDAGALDSLTSNNIIIKVEEKDKNTVGLDADKAEQIPGNTVYDFTMTYDDDEKTPVNNFGAGKVTVTLPYKLELGEDINSIDIWYIDNAGNPVRVEGAVYSNGFVTFQTSHFSYYTVTRLTPQERCARLGSHIEITQSKAATCTEDGYEMTVCQRCAAVISYTPKEKTGHSYTKSEQAATCDKEGKLTQACSCGHVVTKTIPALGHKMVTDNDKTVAATCSAAGKYVEKCERGCGYTTEEPTVQLTHDYKKSEEKSLKATCSAAGYDVYICSLCNDEQIKNETAPLGHNFTDALVQWTWTDDSTAVAKLVCENDPSHTKVLDAVVTRNDDKSQNTSCLGGGSVVYDAAVGYNNKTYTDYNEITVDAPGHKPSVAWYTTETMHYHLCSVCNEKVDSVGHTWDAGTVTEAPTCAQPGSKTIECTVCAYGKVQEIPATGEHTYENGKCSVCGFTENSCRHLPINKTVIDSASHGICTGTVIYKFACDCGEVVEYVEESNNCNYGKETSETTKDEYGFNSTIYTQTCEDCGLVKKDCSRNDIDAANCVRRVVYSTEYLLNGAKIAYAEAMVYEASHPGVTVTDTVVVEEEGLCGTITFTYKKCICGKYTVVSVDDSCSWGWGVGEGLNETTSHGMCWECGATQDMEWTYTAVDGDPCKLIQNMTTTYSYGDKVLHTYVEHYERDNHKEVLEDYEMLGDSCEDGIVVKVKCETCGERTEGFIRDHEPVNRQIIDVSQYNLCSDYLIQTSCLCEEEFADNNLLSENGNGCSFSYGWDKETGKEFRYCYKCGVRVIEDITYGEKDANCHCETFTQTSYVNAEGQVLFTGYGHGTTTRHNIKEEAKLDEGATSCEDGYTVRQYCTDCTYEDTYTNNYHNPYLVATYDMTAFGSCIKSITRYRCPCGAESHVESDGNCNMNWVETGVENQEQYKCNTCGLVETINYSWPETDNECLNHVVKVYTFSKEGVETTVRFTIEEQMWEHDYIFQLSLKDGATTCSQGFTGVGTCQTCDAVTEISGFWCNTYKVRNEAVDNGKMCSPVYLIQYSCACGKNGGTNIRWSDNRCMFNESVYSSELEAWVHTCSACGSYYTNSNESKPVEGSTCLYEETYVTTYYDKDGNLLFENRNTYQTFHHDYAVSFQDANGNPWAGKDCSEGFYVVQTCQGCGHVSKYEQLTTDHDTYVSERVQLHDGTDLCGPLTLIKGACPCGKRTNAYVEHDCNFNHSGWHEDGRQKMECSACGLYFYNKHTETRVEGECAVEIHTQRDFYLGDVRVALVDETYINDAHRWVYTYNNKPASCEEGWSCSYSCFDCGKLGGTSSDNYHHSINTIAYYDLSRYGMCKGYIEVEDCACGKNSRWYFTGEDCVWEYQSTDKDGVATYYCKTCNTYCYRSETGERDENCNYTGTERLLFVRDEVTVLDVTLAEKSVRHSTSVTSSQLVTPGTSCEAGVYVIWTCQYCAQTFNTTEYYHYNIQTDKVETSCGTTYRREACACGEQSYVYNNDKCRYNVLESKETGDRLNGSSMVHRECTQCGVNIRWEREWTKPATSCKQVEEGTVTINYGGETWGLEFRNVSTEHEWGEGIYTLKPGATTCIGNLSVTNTCKVCGQTSEGIPGDGHHMNKVATLDLKDYGATCGGELYQYRCPCGATGRYSLGEDSLCQLQQQGTEMWIDNVLNDVYTQNPGGTRWFYSYAWTYTCAVTDPACAMKLRLAEYWQVKDCVATRYQCWQYFDKTANDWVEIATVALGDQTPYHAYTDTEVNTTENGATVTGTKRDCACGAYYYELKYAYADGTYKTVVDAKDTTGTDYYREVNRVYEYMFVHNGKALATREYSRYLHHDDRTYWTEHVYTHNPENPCEITTSYTNSDGDAYTDTSKHISGWESYTTVKESTCTQFGEQRRDTHCYICDEVISSEIYKLNPSNHSWYENDGVTMCYHCGLENTNGASEGIIIEDLTEQYGNGTQYVAGYWNKAELAYVNNVSVIIDGREPEVLEGIDFTQHETLTAVCFDKAQADAAAAQIAGGESYQLRLNFVTQGMEYAITFTPDAAQ